LSTLQKNQVRAMLSNVPEVKAYLYDTTQNVATGGTNTRISGMAQGLTTTNRIGDCIRRREIGFMYTITVGAAGVLAAADIYNTVRVVIFSWLVDDTVAPTVDQILDTSLATANTISLPNNDTAHLYKIHYDMSHVVFNTPIWNGAAVTWQHGVGGTYQTPKPVRIPLKGIIDYNNTAVSGKNNLYVLLISDSAFAPNPTIEFSSRLLFQDS